MRTSVAFAFVDVFADEPLHGNPLAVIDDADELAVPVMQAIAREFNQSETTFIVKPTAANATVRLRSFTPNGSEVFGAGHNALGAWLALAQSRPALFSPSSGSEPGTYWQQIGPDVLPVEVRTAADRRPVVSMSQSAPVFGDSVRDRAQLAAALGLRENQLADEAAQVVSTGAGHLLVALTERSAVDATRPDSNELAVVLAAVGGEGCYVFSRDPHDPGSAAYARFFNPVMGIAEDPATGTAAGPLAALLVSRGQASDATETIIEQGFALGRPSRIRVFVNGSDVRVSGTGLVVANGTLHL
ncbi:PhzF family phenazine biosynthesis protein [Subtercola lobariae]|uniref:Epimerase n=1 Tax=Subtercola lobariae TaxID=1588641 RepID=A0A917B3X0_9MICO|nr:PhzF family phenazine biosynthesis protein [Subtercola lobariae]GGF21979.1 epimerase [Subtercola lobariae]